METSKSIKIRHSCRDFGPSTMSEEDIRSILEAGMSAPSAMNRRPYDFILVEDQKVLAPLFETKPTFKLFQPNPVSILIVADLTKCLSEDLMNQDIGAVAENMLLMATDMGYQSLWGGIPSGSDVEKGLRELFAIPEGHRASVFLTFGKGNKAVDTRTSRYEDGKVHRSKW